MRRTTRTLLALTLPLVLTATACGDDDGTGVRNIDGAGADAGSASASGSASGPGSASASGSASGAHGEASGGLGDYDPVSDVSSHARVTLDVCDINDLLPSDGEIDDAAITAIYTEGENSASGDGNRTLQGFATGERDEPLWNLYTDRFGDAWLDDYVTSALEATGPFEGEPDAVRRQAIQKGLQNQTLIAWAFHELDAAREDIEAGETDPASGAPHKVDEAWAFYHGAAPSCAPFGTAEKRGADFGTGDAANQAVLSATETMRDAAVDGDLEAFEQGYDQFVEAVLLTYVQATLKYATSVTQDLADGDQEAARVHQAEGWAFFRVIEPFVAQADPEAADTIAGVLDLTNPPSEDAEETVHTALEGVYDDLGLTADEIGELQD